MHESLPERDPFNDSHDRILFLMCTEEWCTESEQVDSPEPTYIAHISIEPREANDVYQAFGEELDILGLTVADIAGHHLIVSTTIDNQTSVTEFPNQQQLKAAYDAKYGELLARWKPRHNDIEN